MSSPGRIQTFYTCRICGINISPQRHNGEKEAWDTEFQLLHRLNQKKEVSPLVEPNHLPRKGNCQLRDGNIYHAACWRVVERASGLFKFNAEWLKCFRQCIEDLYRFLPTLTGHSEASPDILDEGVEEDREEDPYPREDLSAKREHDRGIFDGLNLPQEIMDLIFLQVEDPEDIWALESVALQRPSPHVWMSLGRRFLVTDARISRGSPEETAKRIQCCIWNTDYGDFPHSLSLYLVWNNVEYILAHMVRIMGKDFVQKQACVEDDFVRDEQKAEIPLSSIAGATSVKLHFIPLRSRESSSRRVWPAVFDDDVWNSFCGIEIDGNVVGWKGDSSIDVYPGLWSGIRMACWNRSHPSVQLKYGDVWDRTWHPGYRPHKALGPRRKLLEWVAGSATGSLVVSFDSIVITGILLDAGSGLGPVSWEGNPPPVNLIPVPLVDLLPRELEADNYKYFTHNVSGISRISWNHIDVDFPTVRSLFIMFDNGEHITIGRLSGTAPRRPSMAFVLNRDQGEAICAVGYARGARDSVALKFYTNFGRMVLIGDREAADWTVIKAPNGLFFSSRGPGIWVLQCFGCFQPRDSPSIAEIDAPDVTKPADWLPIPVSSGNHGLLGPAFFQIASLENISKITLYRELQNNMARGSFLTSKPLVGMKIFYHDNRLPVALGEFHRRDSISEEYEPTVEVSGKIRRIHCYYKPRDWARGCSRISGFVLHLDDSRTIQCGETGDGANVYSHEMDVNEGNKLLWVSSGEGCLVGVVPDTANTGDDFDLGSMFPFLTS